MQKLLTPFICVFFTITAATSAFAGPVGEFSASVASERVDDSSTAQSHRLISSELVGGYTYALNEDFSLAPGVSFDYQRGLLAAAETSAYAMGLTLSTTYRQWSLLVKAVLFAEQKSNSGIVETGYSEGSGFALTVRWLNWWSGDGDKRWGLGPSLSLESLHYGKKRVGSLPEQSQGRTVESLRPGLTAIYHF